jgi:Uma2 family endonuclease
MASLPNSKTITYDEWLRLPEVNDAIEEVIDGEVRIMPPAKFRHAKMVRRLCKALDAQLDPKRYLALDTVFGLVIRKSPLTSRVPDLAVFDLRTVVEQDGYIHSAPQLIVEVLSPGNTRRGVQEKLEDFASIGVPEVWLVSPEACTVEVLRLENGGLRCVQISSQGIVTPHDFPAVSIDIATIWLD